MKKNILIIAAAIVSLVLLITGSYLFYWKSKPAAVTPDTLTNTPAAENAAKTDNTADMNKATEDATKGVLPDIQTNPLDKKPDLNPVDKTNPYKNIKTNPFK